jgi:hypothetical protein
MTAGLPSAALAARKIGQDESVTAHKVLVTGLVPYDSLAGNGDVGQYAYYVGSQRTDDSSWATYGGPDTNANKTHLRFQTTPLDTNQDLSVIMVPLGQMHVYAGHDLYVEPTIAVRSWGGRQSIGNNWCFEFLPGNRQRK